MRQESTGKPDPERASATEPAEPGRKRGFFAAAGARLKRAMTGRAEPVPATIAAPAVSAEEGDGEGDGEVSTSVQARARELLSHDRAHGTGRTRASAEAATPPTNGEEPARRTSPPPLPTQRTAAERNGGEATGLENTEQPSTGVVAIPPQRAARAAAKRPMRDSKSDALRARLGAAKAALAEAQAKRAAEAEVNAAPVSEAAEHGATEPSAAALSSQPSAADQAFVDDKPAPEITFEEADLVELQLEAEAELLEDADAAELIAADAAGASAAGAADIARVDAAQHDAAEVDARGSTLAGDTADSKATDAGDPVADAANSEPLAASDTQPMDAELESADATPCTDAEAQPTAATGSDEANARSDGGSEPIRTLTIARLLARQGYFERSLSIYDELLANSPSDRALSAEAEKVRAKKRKKGDA